MNLQFGPIVTRVARLFQPIPVLPFDRLITIPPTHRKEKDWKPLYRGMYWQDDCKRWKTTGVFKYTTSGWKIGKPGLQNVSYLRPFLTLLACYTIECSTQGHSRRHC